MSSPYAQLGPRLVELGHSVTTIAPGTKAPGEVRRGQWWPAYNWQRFAYRLPTRFDLLVWATWPDAGVGLVVGPAGGHVGGVDIDTDHPGVRGAILSAIPPTTVIKRGAKGETRFFRLPKVTKSRSWRCNGLQVCDLIGPGRQTVLPPTIHPTTGHPYHWIGPDALEHVAPGDLPELTPEHVAAIDEALKAHGYVEEPARLHQGTARRWSSDDGDNDSIWSQLNNQARANLDAWVPQLGLYRCRRTVRGFEAVATWRPSNTGQPAELRKLNLKIHPKGIVDFGDGSQGYSPLDLVIAAFHCSLDQAFGWLSDRLGWNDNPILIMSAERLVQAALMQVNS